jgi:hypothetical protein
MDCKSCLHTITIPGTPDPTPESAMTPAPAPVRLPTAQVLPSEQESPADPNVADFREADPEPGPALGLYRSYTGHPPRMGGPANRIVAGAGAGLLFIGLFTPMLHGPLGTWMSFVDVPWKVVTVGFMVADEASKAAAEPSRPKAAPQPKASGTKADPKDAGKGFLALIVVIGSVLYPLVILAATVLCAIQISTGRSCGGFLFAGAACGIATAVYLFGILLLNSIEEIRFAMLATSPGFGWAIMFIGSMALVIAGLIRPRPQTA